MPLADKRRLFDINFWGVVHGCRTAIRLMKDRGGVLINIGSEVSDVAIPLQGIYSASKHAVKGYTDALRMELEHDRIPIAVTLVKPSAINTPYPEHARNYLKDGVPALPPPLYAPEVVAETILRCAERPVRDIIVGGAGRLQVAMGRFAPRLTDRFMTRAMFEPQKARDHSQPPEGNLNHPQRDGRTTGRQQSYTMKSSLYTRAALSPAARLVPLAAAGAWRPGYRRRRQASALLAVIGRRQRDRARQHGIARPPRDPRRWSARSHRRDPDLQRRPSAIQTATVTVAKNAIEPMPNACGKNRDVITAPAERSPMTAPRFSSCMTRAVTSAAEADSAVDEHHDSPAVCVLSDPLRLSGSSPLRVFSIPILTSRSKHHETSMSMATT